MLLIKPTVRRAAFCILLFFMAPHHTFAATTWGAEIEQLAVKIASVTGPGAVSVDLENKSSLANNQRDEVRRQLLTQLASHGLRLVDQEQAAATIHITLSENLTSYLWIAAIHVGNNPAEIEMVALPRPDPTSPQRQTSTITLHKTLLWSQTTPMLDIAVLDGSPPHMIVLEPDRVALYRYQGSGWEQQDAMTISHAHPWPRDVRGRLVIRKDHLFDAYLPGVFCQSGNRTPVTLNCRESDDSWPLGNDLLNLNGFYASARNFFTGVLVPGIGKQSTVSSFYTAAGLPRANYILWLFAGTDSRVHMLDGITDQVMQAADWGDEVASIRTSCGSGWQVLASSRSSNSDSIRAYEFADRVASPITQPADFSGSVVSLWTAMDGVTAFAVSRDDRTEKYEAFRLSVSCIQ